MNETAGAVAPRQGQPVQGYVLRPGTNDTIPAEATATHSFLSAIEGLIRRVTYHSEQDRLDALTAVAGYRKHALGTHASRVVGEDEPAPVEDARLRRAPGQPGQPVPALGAPVIDYNALAAALIAQQQAQQAAAAELKDTNPEPVDSGEDDRKAN